MSSLPNLSEDVEVLIDADTIARRVRELAARIEEEHRGKDTVIVGVLKGSVLFVADLVREIDLPISLDFLGVSSYGDATETSGVVRITSDLSRPIEGKHVVIVEDIVDSGLTMHFLLANLAARDPVSLKICTLLHKPARTKVQVPLDYVGFEVEDRFLVGYGLDHAERYRNLPFIAVVP